MKNRLAWIAAFAAVAVAVPVAGLWIRKAHAQDHEGRAFVEVCDTNGDGKLTLDEFPFGEDLFDAADANSDGVVTLEELRALQAAKGSDRKRASEDVNALFRKLDRDGDGRISNAECPEDGRERFRELDRDGDGFVTRAEAGRGAVGRDGQPARERADLKAKLRKLDRNGDGRISRTECPEEALPAFPSLDADADGTVSFAEAEAAQASGLLARLREGMNKFREVDRDGDGIVTREEFPLQAPVGFNELDEDGDGGIVVADVLAFVGHKYSAPARGFVERYDRNGDGRVSREEFGGSEEAFDRLDADHDGSISREEACGPASGEER
ncbi:MAG: EF-hand domain-containing protein [Planctomycetes bacterium]|nr:EF-hand domain-containing protein [Planctomycetota bacterium]